MSRLLLISSSNVHGFNYLDHAEGELRDFLSGVERVLFVPFALADHEGYAARVRERLAGLGLAVDSLHATRDPVGAIGDAEAMFVGGGNTFRLLTAMCRLGLMTVVGMRVAEGMPYVGSSAGTNLATRSIETTNDMPIVYPPTFAALGLVPFNVNPHYLDADPHSTHKGETRETRIREFHEEHEAPVVGLREPAMLRREGEALTLRGTGGARLFRRGAAAEELATGADLSELLRWRPAESE